MQHVPETHAGPMRSVHRPQTEASNVSALQRKQGESVIKVGFRVIIYFHTDDKGIFFYTHACTFGNLLSTV